MTQQPVLSHGAPFHDSMYLPVSPPDELIGRDTDLDALHAALKADTAVLLHGPAGIGKTALVATLATGYAELSGGVLWMECAGDTFRSLVTRAARAYALDVPAFDAALETTCKQVRRALQDNRPLVVLDGDVRLEDAREFIRECASGVPLLLTHRMMLSGPWTSHDITLLNRQDTVELLTHYAGDFLSDGAIPFESLMEVVNGHPLSIQIVARQLAMGTSAEDLLAQMPDLPPGQKNLAIGVLMAAYRILSSELQGMVMLLGTAFAAGASEELLCDVSGARPELLRSRMQQLADYGLAGQRRRHGQMYYTVHTLVHEFVQAFLRGKKRLETMVARYEQGVPAYLRRHVDEHSTSHYNALAVEFPNVIGAGLYAARQNKPDLLREITQVLDSTRSAGFVAECGFEPELDWLHYVSTHPRAADAGIMGLVPEPKSVGVQISATESVPEPLAEAEVLEEVEAADLADTIDAVDSESALGEAVAGNVEDEDTVGADDAEDMTDTEDTPDEPPAEEAQEASASDEDDLDQARLDQVPALPVTDEGESDDAAETPRVLQAEQEQVLSELQADGDIDDELAALEALAKLNLEGANYEAVLSYLDRGTALAQEADNPQREGEMLGILGDLQAELSIFEGAERTYREAISALRPVEAWFDIGLTLEKLGTVYMKLQRVEEALGVWQQALPIFEKEARAEPLRRVLNRLGDVYARQMQWAPARIHYTRAFEVAEDAGDERAQFVQLSKLAYLMERSGNHKDAVEAYWQALYLAFRLGEDELLSATELALARLLIDDTAQLDRALQLLEAAAALKPDNTDVQRLLSRAKTRRDRLVKADVTLPLAQDSLQDYAEAMFNRLS